MPVVLRKYLQLTQYYAASDVLKKYLQLTQYYAASDVLPVYDELPAEEQGDALNLDRTLGELMDAWGAFEDNKTKRKESVQKEKEKGIVKDNQSEHLER